MSLEILNLLQGSDDQFARGLVELGWFDYPPTITKQDFRGRARLSLDPELLCAGQVTSTGVWVYKLRLDHGGWQDAQAVIESQLRQEPQFVIVFYCMPQKVVVFVPEDPDKAMSGEDGMSVAAIHLETLKPSNYEIQVLHRFKAAPKNRFRVKLQELISTERVTKKFYDEFKKELERFKDLIQGLEDEGARSYSLLMLNRLMFIYFIQRKGFLNGEEDYLRRRLEMVQRERSARNFFSFYKSFLRVLFHDGLNSRDRSPSVDHLLGNVPYLNGGLFDEYDIEDPEKNPDLDIPDQAFLAIFNFFDGYEWCLDSRPSRTEKEINPDVLGYIFEKHINSIQPGEQKAKGAYYTKEDITSHISRNTIVPYVLDSLKSAYPAAFHGDNSVWRRIQDMPDLYIYNEVLHGVDKELPQDVSCGINDTRKRALWNENAPTEFGLPWETWREIVARRRHYQGIRERAAAGGLNSADDLVGLNMDIHEFLLDCMRTSADPAFIMAVWEILTGSQDHPALSVLDPTCGSGAFLLAALNMLQPIYASCLAAMARIVSQNTGPSDVLDRFREVLAHQDDRSLHPNPSYFVLKTIILKNLFGVDIMPEAVEICKLRLFLKLVAQVAPDPSKDNMGLEPLPDMEFNIRSGNTLIGFVTYDEVKKFASATSTLDYDDSMSVIERKADEAAALATAFREHQSSNIRTDLSDEKTELRSKQMSLEEDLNGYLAKRYAISSEAHPQKYSKWLADYEPFHWFVDFRRIMASGGFDVIIGNPPYVEYRIAKKKYNLPKNYFRSEDVENLYAFCMERSCRLLARNGRFGMIVPSSLVGLDEAVKLRRLLLDRYPKSYISTYAIRPSKLFDGVDQRLCIYVGAGADTPNPGVLATRYHHWNAEERPSLFATHRYIPSYVHPRLDRIMQTGCEEAIGVLSKLECKKAKVIGSFYASKATGVLMHYHRSPRYWIRALDFEPYFKSDTRDRSVHHFRDLHFCDENAAKVCGAIINSSLFFFWFLTTGNGRNITGNDVSLFPVGELGGQVMSDLCSEFDALMEDYKANSFIRQRKDCEFQEFNQSKSKRIMDRIDSLLGRHYDFSDEELDFIINYDIKYRMGLNGAEDAEEDD